MLRRFVGETPATPDLEELRTGIREISDDAVVLILETNGDNPQRQAVCRAELERRHRDRQELLFFQQYKIAKFAVEGIKWLTWATFALLAVNLVEFLANWSKTLH